MWNLKYGTNEFIYEANRSTDIENKHGYQRGKEWGRNKIGFGD